MLQEKSKTTHYPLDVFILPFQCKKTALWIHSDGCFCSFNNISNYIYRHFDPLHFGFERCTADCIRNIVRSLHFNPFQMANISNDELCMWHKTDDSIYLNINERISRSPTSTLSFVISFVESRFK